MPMWTDKLSAVSTAIACMGIFITIAVYLKILWESILSRKDQKMPVISFRFRYLSGGLPGLPGYSYRLVNVGGGAAFITKFEILSSRIYASGDITAGIDSILGPCSGDEDLEIAYAIEPVPPGTIGTTMGPPELRDPKTHYLIEYRDAFGRQFSTEFKNCRHEFAGPAREGYSCACKAITGLILLLIGGAIGFGIARYCRSDQLRPPEDAVTANSESTLAPAAAVAPPKGKALHVAR